MPLSALRRCPVPIFPRGAFDGFHIFLAAHADEVLDPSSWTPPDPLHAFDSLLYFAEYIHTTDNLLALIQVAGDIPSILLGVNDPDFQDLAEPAGPYHSTSIKYIINLRL